MVNKLCSANRAGGSIAGNDKESFNENDKQMFEIFDLLRHFNITLTYRKLSIEYQIIWKRFEI